jgi:hypothetical protein
MRSYWFIDSLKYAGNLISFAAALLAVLAETRFRDKQGLQSITTYGWAAIGAAAAGLLISSLGAWLEDRGQILVVKMAEVGGNGGGGGYFVMSKQTWDGDLFDAAGGGGLSPLAAADKLCLTELTTNTSWHGYSIANSNGQLVAPKVHAFLCSGGHGCNNLQPSTMYYFANAGDASAGGASLTTDSNGDAPQDDAAWSASDYFNGHFSYWTDRDWLWSGRSYNNGTKSSTAWGGDSWAANNGGSQTCNLWSYGSACGSGAIFGSTNSGNGSTRWWTNGVCCNTPQHLICFVNP